jgi:hypothetical protein
MKTENKTLKNFDKVQPAPEHKKALQFHSEALKLVWERVNKTVSEDIALMEHVTVCQGAINVY